MNLFLLSSPMQVVNALEARHHFEIEAEACTLILVPQRPVSLRQIEKVVDRSDWGAVHVLPLFDENGADPAAASGSLVPDAIARLQRAWQSRRRRRRVVQRATVIAQSFSRVERLFLGIYYRKLPRHLASTVAAGEVVLLDDGAGTLVNNEWRRQRAFSPSNQSWRERLRTRLASWLYGYDLRSIEHLTFFTCFDIAVAPHDRKVAHDYPYLRAQAHAQNRTPSVYFLGQPLSEYGIVEEEVYMRYLRVAEEHFDQREVVYVPHRDEHEDMLEQIRAALGWRIQSFDLPIEYELCFRGPLPEAIGGFFTSALETCHVIFGDQIELVAFRLADRHVVDSRRAPHTRRVYDYYEHERSMAVVRPMAQAV